MERSAYYNNQFPNTCPYLDTRCASSISTAPAPGTMRPSRVKHLKQLTPSSIARSISSMIFVVAPLTTIVATALSSRSIFQ